MRHLLVALFLLVPSAACAEDIVILPTRAGVTQSYLLSAPEKGKARGVAILFAGGPGKVDLERETARTTSERGNFLEADTVSAIAKWMLKEPHPREIN